MSLARLAMPLLALTLLTCASGDASTEGEEAAATVAVDRGATGEDPEGTKATSGDPAGGEEVGAGPPQGPRKRALIVAISDYSTSEGYDDLHSTNDVDLIRSALRDRGFAAGDIRVVSDAEATREGIVRAFEEHLIEAFDPSEPGNVAVFHYSGHGHQLTNDNPGSDAEPDGYDEVLVPYGAPNPGGAGYRGSYRGERHLRDDEMGQLIGRLRARVGPEGNVTVFLDACHSGTATRGGELPYRGTPEPIGPPAEATGAEEPGRLSGFDSGSGPATRGVGDDALAPFIVISAATQRQLAQETKGDDGTPVGSLSYGIYKALQHVSSSANYAELFSAISGAMEQAGVSNTPVYEGTIEGVDDRTIFSGQLSPQDYYVEVDRALEDGTVIVRAGSLLGFSPGTRVAFYPPGQDTRLATGEVVSSGPSEATVAVEGADATRLEDAWVFVTQYSLEAIGLDVALDAGLPAELRQRVRSVADDSRFITLVDAPADADVVVSLEGGKAVTHTVGGAEVMSVDAASLDPAAFVSRLEGYAKYRYFRGLDFADPNYRVVLEVVPVVQNSFLVNQGGRSICTPEQAVPRTDVRRTEDGAVILRPGDHYVVRARHEGRRLAHVAVIDLTPSGDAVLLFPDPTGRRTTASEAELAPGQSYMIPECYGVEEDEQAGREILVLLSTQETVDYRPFLGTRTRGPVGDPPPGGAYKAEAVIEVRR